MERLPPYEKSHLAVAAVRLLTHQEGRGPTEEEVAKLLGLAPDYVRNLLRNLAELGVLKAVRNAFESRVEVADHLRLEELPRGEGEPVIESELEAFHERHRKKQEEMGKLFGGGEVTRRKEERVKRLEDEFKSFRHRGPRLPGETEDDEKD